MKLKIESDLSTKGTKLYIDDVEVTSDKFITNFRMYCSAPYKEYDASGYVSVYYDEILDDGTTSSVNFSSNTGDAKEKYESIGNSDTVTKDSFYCGLGRELIDEKVTLVDSIISFCDKNNINTVDKDVLMSRSFESLKDRASDLGVL